MHSLVRALEKVASRYAPSRLLSFGEVHVFVAMQLMNERGHVSRKLLSNELALGGGAVKTLIKHMKMNGFVETSNSGTKLTEKGERVFKGLASVMPTEMELRRSQVALGKYNYAILLREFGFAIKSGIEQRDAAIKMGATGATTLLYRDGRFAMFDSGEDPLSKEQQLKRELVDTLNPWDGDAVIIGSADKGKVAELAAKSAALATIMSTKSLSVS